MGGRPDGRGRRGEGPGGYLKNKASPDDIGLDRKRSNGRGVVAYVGGRCPPSMGPIEEDLRAGEGREGGRTFAAICSQNGRAAWFPDAEEVPESKCGQDSGREIVRKISKKY